METLWKDIRYAIRMLLKQPGFTAVAVLTLALGIGANTAIFSVADALIFRPLLLKDLDRLVILHGIYEGRPGEPDFFSPADFRDFREQAKSVDFLSATVWWNANVTGEGEPEQVQGYRVTGDFFRALGSETVLGRPLLPEEDRPGNARVVVLSYGLWQRRFGGNAKIQGRSLQLNGQAFEVVGVMPRDFRYPPDAELWIPMAMDAREENLRGSFYLRTVARLKPGYSLRQASAEISELARRIQREHPDDHAKFGGSVALLREYVSGDLTRNYTLLLLGAVTFVLLIACANVAGLLLARLVGARPAGESDYKPPSDAEVERELDRAAR